MRKSFVTGMGHGQGVSGLAAFLFRKPIMAMTPSHKTREQQKAAGCTCGTGQFCKPHQRYGMADADGDAVKRRREKRREARAPKPTGRRDYGPSGG